MTDKPTPTDAELEALLLDKLPASKHYIRPVIEKMVAAMQAAIDKWGQPAQALRQGLRRSRRALRLRRLASSLSNLPALGLAAVIARVIESHQGGALYGVGGLWWH